MGIMGLFIVNSIVITTNRGLEQLLINSLTGELMIGIRTDEQYSVFGNEIPIVSEYDSVPPLTYYAEVKQVLEQNAAVAVFTPIVSTAASLSVGRYNRTVPVFGIDPTTYFSVCSGITIDAETQAQLLRGGVVLNEMLKDEIESYLQRPLQLDEPIVFSMYSGNSFKLRKGYYAGYVRYSGNHDVINRIVLADPSIPRGLINYTVGVTQSGLQSSVTQHNEQADTAPGASIPIDNQGYSGTEGSQSNTIQSQPSGLVDDLFAETSDIDTSKTSVITLDEIESLVARTEEERAETAADTGAWSFVLIKTRDGHYSQMASKLGELFAKNKLPLKIQSWRTASGSSIQILFALQLAFYFGMVFLMFGALLVIMNSLVLTVLERTSEIGTIRSLGSSKSFIAKMLAIESIVLTCVGTILGIFGGIIVCLVLKKASVELKNPLLISMFGGTRLVPEISIGNIILQLVVGILTGSFAWIYPLRLALKIPPIVAINKGNT